MKTQERTFGVNGQWSMIKSSREGFSLIEILLGVAILSLIVTAIAGALVYADQSVFLVGERARALDIAEEGVAAARNIRDESFANLTVGNNGIATTSSIYSLSGASDLVDGIFTRVVNIAQTDNVRRKITSTVTWTLRDGQQVSAQLISELANWARKKAGGAPSLCATFDLTHVNSGSDSADAISIAFRYPYIYLGRQSNPGATFFVFDVTNPNAPVLDGSMTLNGTPNAMVASGNYVFVASTSNTSEIEIIDVSNPASPFEPAHFDLTVANSGDKSASALSIAIGSGNHLYLGRAQSSSGREFYVFDISTPTAPALLGQVNASGAVNDLAAAGTYVYAAVSDPLAEFQVFDVSNPATPFVAATLAVSPANPANGLSVRVNGNTAYIGETGSPSAADFYTIDVTTPTAPSVVGSLNLGNFNIVALDVSTTTQTVFSADTSSSANNYSAIDVSDPTAPASLSILQLTGVPYDLVYASQFASCNVFIASGADNSELQIISP